MKLGYLGSLSKMPTGTNIEFGINRIPKRRLAQLWSSNGPNAKKFSAYKRPEHAGALHYLELGQIEIVTRESMNSYLNIRVWSQRVHVLLNFDQD